MENGYIYKTIVDPILKPMRLKLASQITDKSIVADIACGTGEQCIALADKCNSVFGIDYSKSMIAVANQKKEKLNLENIKFIHSRAENLLFKDKELDFAVSSLAIHQFGITTAKHILTEMKRVSHSIIIVDYTVPLPDNNLKFGVRFAEFLAGKEHNKAFKEFCKYGGIPNIFNDLGFKIQKQETFAKGAFTLFVA